MAQTATALAAFPHWRNLTGDFAGLPNAHNPDALGRRREPHWHEPSAELSPPSAPGRARGDGPHFNKPRLRLPQADHGKRRRTDLVWWVYYVAIVAWALWVICFFTGGSDDSNDHAHRAGRRANHRDRFVLRAGGWACGASGLAIRIVLAIDFWEPAATTYQLNHPETEVLSRMFAMNRSGKRSSIWRKIAA